MGDININKSNNKAPYLANKVQKKGAKEHQSQKAAPFSKNLDRVEISTPASKIVSKEPSKEQVKEWALQAMETDMSQAPAIESSVEYSRADKLKDVKEKYSQGYYNQEDMIRETAKKIAEEILSDEQGSEDSRAS